MLLDITPLKISRDYRILFFGQLISFFGSMMTFIVVPWQMFELTKSNEMVGYLFLAEFVPMFCLAFVGGALADALDKRKMLRLTEIGQTLVTTILLVNSFLPNPRIWVLFIAVALHGGFAALQRPAFESLIQRLFQSDLMPAVSALNSLRFNFGAIVSPAIAGIIVAKFGSSIAYGIDLFTFIASLVAVFLINAVPSPENADRPSLKTVIEGCRYAFSRQELLGTYLIDIIAMFFAMPQALYPALASIYGGQFLGFYPASLAAGMLLGSLTSGWTRNVHRHGLMVVIAAALWGVGIIFFGLSDNVWLALVFLAAAGFADMISGIFRGAIWNQTIPYYLRGRLASIEMISFLTGPMLGSAKMGIVAERFGVKTAIVSGGVLCVVFVGILSLFLPKFVIYDGREGIKQKEREEAERREMIMNEVLKIMPLIKKRQLEIWSQLSGDERERFIESLPASKEQIENLFDYIDRRLEKEPCIHNLRFTMQFLMENRLNMPRVMSWLNENGGYCDCEVLQNIETKWFEAFDEE